MIEEVIPTASIPPVLTRGVLGRAGFKWLVVGGAAAGGGVIGAAVGGPIGAAAGGTVSGPFTTPFVRAFDP